MTNEEIKKECLALYAQIMSCNTKLSELRKICKHEKVFKGKYEIRVGQTINSFICETCGEKLRDNHDNTIN